MKPVTLPPPVLHPDGRLTLFLPLPATAISPNGATGHSRAAALRKAKRIKIHKTRARLAMVDALARYGLSSSSPAPRFTGYSLAFHFPTVTFRDDDNADASCKAYRDGIAAALHIDDRLLKKVALSTHQKDPTTPRLEFTLHPSP